MRDNPLDDHTPCLRTPLAPRDSTCHSTQSHAHIASERLAPQCQPHTNLTKNPTAIQLGPSIQTNLTYAHNTKAHQPTKTHTNTRTTIDPTPTHHKEHSPEMNTDQDTQSYRTTHTCKPNCPTQTTQNQTKHNKDTQPYRIRVGGGTPTTSRKRKTRHQEHTTTPHQTVDTLAKLLNTCTDTEFAVIINQLPDTWHSKTTHGITLSKRLLTRCVWGSYKDDQSVSQFQTALLHHKHSIHQITQYDNALSHSITQHHRVWTRSIKDTVT
jgi:hypothetical protein